MAGNNGEKKEGLKKEKQSRIIKGEWKKEKKKKGQWVSD